MTTSNQTGSSYLRAAHARIAHAISTAELPDFSTFAQRDEFEGMRDHLRAVTAAMDEYIAACAREVESNMTRNLDVTEYLAVATTGLENSGLLDAIESYEEGPR